LIDNNLLIDFGPDIFASCAQLGISLCDVEYLLITHSHLDHFDPTHLIMRARAFRLTTDLPEMTMVAGPSIWTKWDQSGGSDQSSEIRRMPILPGRSVQLSGYSIRSIQANHNSRIGDAMNYIIDDGNLTLLYASDSGVYEEHVWEQLQGCRFDAVVMEGTIWNRDLGGEHLNEGDFARMLERLRGIGAISDRTVLIATHFSHQSVDPHEQLAEQVKRHGAHCAHDGFTIEL